MPQRFRPEVPLHIPEPCTEPWDSMQGGSRTRFCAACSREVVNTATHTATELSKLLRLAETSGGPMPCMRIATYADGSWLTAGEAAVPSRRGALAAAALVAISATVHATAQATVGKIAVPRATFSGQVLDLYGKPAAAAKVYVHRSVNGHEQRVEVVADAQGRFSLHAQPGEWHAGASGPFTLASERTVQLQAGKVTGSAPFKLESIQVTAGAPVPVPVPTTPSPRKR